MKNILVSGLVCLVLLSSCATQRGHGVVEKYHPNGQLAERSEVGTITTGFGKLVAMLANINATADAKQKSANVDSTAEGIDIDGAPLVEAVGGAVGEGAKAFTTPDP